jgi:hypothetical protein
MVVVHSSVAATQILTEPSWPSAATKFPSGENAAEKIGADAILND